MLNNISKDNKNFISQKNVNEKKINKIVKVVKKDKIAPKKLDRLNQKIIKSGCRVENRQLAVLKNLKACFCVDLIIAWRIFFLTKYSRENPDAPCTACFRDEEWKALYCYVNRTTKIPQKVPTLRPVVHSIASLGGFLCRKADGEPGPITLWRGLIELGSVVRSYLVFAEGLNPPLRGQPIYV